MRNCFCLDMDHATCIADQYIYLLENLEVTDNLFQRLVDANVISVEDRKDINSDISYSKPWTSPLYPVQKLLSLVSNKSAKDFNRFVKALDATGQGQMSKILKDPLDMGKKYASTR